MLEQRYISNELFHFVGKSEITEEARYELLVRILRGGWLTAPPHHPNVSGNLVVNPSARLSDNQMYTPQVVCFCDIPVSDLEIHMRKYGRFGIGFPRSFLLTKGANPVFYVAKGSLERRAGTDVPSHFNTGSQDDAHGSTSLRSRSDIFDANVPRYLAMFSRWHAQILRRSTRPGVTEEARELQDLQRFFDFDVFAFVKMFDASLSEADDQNFYMEREWRTLDNINFSLSDVSSIILPTSFSRRFRADVNEYSANLKLVEDPS